MFFKASFRESLGKAIDDMANYSSLMEEFEDYMLQSEDDAQAVVSALDKLLSSSIDRKAAPKVLHAVIAFFQMSDGEEATVFLRKHGIPRLIRLIEAHWNDVELRDDLRFALKQLGSYQTPEGVPVIVRAIREWPDGFMWTVILGAFAEPDAPQTRCLIDLIGSDLPSGFAGVAYLDVVNRLARETGLEPHPFASEQGIKRLKALLTDEDSDAAISATAALPFLPANSQSELFSLALEHLNWEVQAEAAWAMAHCGNERGFRLLVEFAKDVHKFYKVARYMLELGREYLLPMETHSADFLAMAEMSQWLQHPNEMGRVPDELTLYDTRELYWPPTDDRRQVWLFRYVFRHWPDGGAAVDDVGLGMVGSVTWAMFGKITENLNSEQVYAIHCCWELRQNKDSRAPQNLDADAGLEILRQYNPGF